MDNIPKNVKNPNLYKKAKKKADETYQRNSAYKSMFLVSTYKKMGGKYTDDTNKNIGVSRWNDEIWIQVIPYIEDNKIVPCGSGNNKKACRPLKRIDKNTPITLKELIEIHGKKKLLSLAKKKRANMDNRINWRLGILY